MKYFDLFSGIGGFHIGMSQAGHECVGACEIDRYARQVYGDHFPDTPIWEDARQLDPTELPEFDCLVGGFPCQAFSIAGKRRGFEDTRGSLFFEIARIAKEKRPQYLLLENVKGLLNHDEGRTFRVIISTLQELGYAVEWQVLNSKYFVPQNRERVFIVGHLGGFSGRKIFPLGTDDEKINVNCNQINNPVHSTNRVYGEDGIARALKANCGNKTGFYAVLTPDRPNKRQNGRRFKEDGEPSFTLTAQDKHGISDGARIRRLTPIECERLQGFPDNWTEGLSDTQRYKCCGNAVTVPVVQYIAEHLVL